MRPKIRFKGVAGNWTEKQLKDIAVFNPKAKLPEVFEYVDLESVVGTEMIAHRTENKETAPSRAQRLAQTGDLFFQTVRPYQKNNYLFEKPDSNYVFSTGYAQMRPLIDGRFLFGVIQEESFVSDVLDNCTGSSYPAINSTTLAELKVKVPLSAEEAESIGRFVHDLDTLIEQNQSEVDRLRNLKKAMLQKMFPQKGSKVPEIRFKGFSGDWETKKLGNMASFSKGAGYSKSDLAKSGVPVILYGRMYTNYRTVITDVDTFAEPKSSAVYSRGGEVVVPASGETAEDISIASVVSRPGIILGGDLNVITPYVELDSVFLALAISFGSAHNEMAMRAQGASIFHLHNSDLMTINLMFPEKSEQLMIGQYFQNLDSLIEQRQSNTDRLRHLKQAMLQRMFI